MSIESLKQQARRHEQNEEWQKALDQYNKALAELAREEQVDIGLYNRVGDLYVRVGQLDDGFEHYDKAVELYREAYLPNNAIAVCKKIIRNMPGRHTAYLRIGQIRAEQGFLPDARENFLNYAEKMQQDGDLDESFRALIEFCDLAPDDVGVRVTVAEQMASQNRTDEAVEQFLVARQHFSEKGDQEQADAMEKRVLEIDPDADLSQIPAVVGAGSSVSDEGEIVADFGEISVGDDDSSDFAVDEVDPVAAMAEAGSDDGDSDEMEFDMSAAGEFDISSGEEEEASEALPTMEIDFGDEDEAEEAAEPLPTMEVDFGDEAEEEAEPLPTMEVDFGDETEEEAEPLPTMEVDFGEEDPEAVPTMEIDTGDVEAEPLPTMEVEADEPEPAKIEMPEVDFETEEPAAAVEEAVEEAVADVAVEEEAPQPEPVAEEPVAPEAPAAPAVEEPASSGGGSDYVDLGAMILGDEPEEKSTRFTVAYEEPTGDEEADFAKMLSQFKEKINENLDSSDVRAHYDLGTAYKEMGLLDEAISSFQAALRAAADHLPTYELMGQTFIEMGQPEAAVKVLKRALEANKGVEDDLVGIYYYLARSFEALEEKSSAVEYYDRVFALDINFADVTDRLRELR